MSAGTVPFTEIWMEDNVETLVFAEPYKLIIKTTVLYSIDHL